MNEKISVSLPAQIVGEIKSRVDAGTYASVTEVMRAALQALHREEQVRDQVVDTKIREALNDPRASVPAADVFDRIERIHAERLKANSNGA